MTAIKKGTTANKANPVLDVYVLCEGVLTTPYTLAYQIFDVSDDAKKANPTQVYPTTVGEEQLVDLVAAKLGDGHFAATWAVPSNATVGRYVIRWYAVLDNGGIEFQSNEDFDVLDGVGMGQRGYASVSDLRDEGFTSAMLTDVRLISLIESQSLFIERATKRFFEPREMTLTLDGEGGFVLRFGLPIIAIKSVRWSDQTEAINASRLLVYNRHIQRVMHDPDDRDDPRIDWKFDVRDGSRSTWPKGRGNITVQGVFGYTDCSEWSHAEGTVWAGKTPMLIRRACNLLVAREAAKLVRPEDRFEARERWRIRSESTRDQNYTMGAGREVGAFTGDPEIDDILAQYVAPAKMAATVPRIDSSVDRYRQ